MAEQLGNTPAVCRKCYIHPAVFEGYMAGALKVSATVEDLEEFPAGVWELERQVMRFLKNFPLNGCAPPIQNATPRRRARDNHRRAASNGHRPSPRAAR